MTALDRYQLLEGPALWAEGGGAQRRDVVVRFGKASLIILDGRSEKVLSHWSLAAVRRANPGATPARYVPVDSAAERSDETLDIEDPLLIDAIGAVLAALHVPRQSWLRGRRLAGLAAGLCLLAAGALALPEVLARHTAAVVPMAKRAEIGRMVLDDAQATSGMRFCTRAGAGAALDRLRHAVFARPRTLIIFADAAPETPDTLHLPGDMVLVNEALLARLYAPEALAGYLMAEAERSTVQDPLQPVLRHVGVRATLRLLTQGWLGPDQIRGYGTAWRVAPPQVVDAQAMQARFDRAGIDPGEWIASLPEAQRARFQQALVVPPSLRPEPVLSDSDWLRIQNLCEG